MDEFAERLKQDAGEIRANVSAEFSRRIEASLRTDRQQEPETKSHTPGANLWWASSLTGLTAAVLVIALINWNRPDALPTPEQPMVGTVVPDYVEQLQNRFELQTETADFADPLEEELEKLAADIEKARKSLREDVDFTF